MNKFKSDELITQLEKDIEQIIMAAEHLQTADPVKLSYCPDDGQWTVAQTIDHMNIFLKHYLPLVEKSIVHITRDVDTWFVAGFWGDFLTHRMIPKNVYDIKNKMKTPKRFVPEKSVNVSRVFEEFLAHQHKLLQLLEVSRRRNLNKIHIPLAMSSAFRLKLGDMFRYLVAHEQRHMIQARNAIKAVGIATDKFPVILEAARP